MRVRLNSHKMRWRMRRGPDGRELRESNARFVRWSDGSLQLLVGNEVLDVQQQDISQWHCMTRLTYNFRLLSHRA